jgi:hypothetical protein
MVCLMRRGEFTPICLAPTCPTAVAGGGHHWITLDHDELLAFLAARDGIDALHGAMAEREVKAQITVRMVMAYLTQCDEYVVEVTPAPERRDRGVAGPKPWTRTDLRSLILIDPGRVEEYGHPRADARGTHASPRPHPRRGHWRHFRAERFLRVCGQRSWVRAMWVGDREWVQGGQRYAVVWPPKDPAAAERALIRRIASAPAADSDDRRQASAAAVRRRDDG